MSQYSGLSNGLSALKTSVLVLVTASLAASLSACGGGGGGGESANVVPKVDLSACDQHPEVGSSAILANASRTEFIASDFFGKPYDRFDLEAVLDASVKSTTEYVASLGVTVRKVVTGSPAGKCPNYYTVANADENFLKIWNEASKGTNNNASLQGLFFEFCGSGASAGCRDRQMVNPTILLNHVSDRWTLVHEMMHYNFNQGRKADPKIPANSMIDKMTKYHTAQFKKFYNDFEALPNRGDLSNAVKELSELVKVSHHLMFRKDLEEISIEGMLIDLWAKGEFKNTGARTPSTWYMEFSRGQAIEQAREFEAFIPPLLNAAEQNFWPEIVDEVNAVKALIEMPKIETTRMIKEAKAKIAAKQAIDSGRPVGAPPAEEDGSELTLSSTASFRSKANASEVDFDFQHAHNHLDQLDRNQTEKKFMDAIRELKRTLENDLKN